MTGCLIDRALAELRAGRDVAVIALSRETAEELATKILERAKAERVTCAEAIGEPDERYSECPLIFIRAYEQDCATWSRRTGAAPPLRPLSTVCHPTAIQERLSVKPPALRTVFA